jgi:hypothetical protein
MHIAVSKKGEAIISSYDWPDIALKTETLNSPQRNAKDDQASSIIRFTIKNNSTHTITLPLKPDGCSFTLRPTNTNPQQSDRPLFTRTECDNIIAEPETLKPEETLSLDIDLNRPQWFVEYKGKPTPLGKLPWDYRYRIIYRDGSVTGLKADIVSNSFHGRGSID